MKSINDIAETEIFAFKIFILSMIETLILIIKFVVEREKITIE